MHDLDRFDVATLIFRFWWVVVGLSLALGAWLLRSIAESVASGRL